VFTFSKFKFAFWLTDSAVLHKLHDTGGSGLLPPRAAVSVYVYNRLNPVAVSEVAAAASVYVYNRLNPVAVSEAAAAVSVYVYNRLNPVAVSEAAAAVALTTNIKINKDTP
jgi:hypothetical protein